MEKRQFFWSATVRCAQCDELAGVDQLGATPHSWTGIIVSERKAAIARTPREAVSETAEYEQRPYPVCSFGCGAKLLIGRALEGARTKAERITLIAQLREALNGEEAKPPVRPN